VSQANLSFFFVCQKVPIVDLSQLRLCKRKANHVFTPNSSGFFCHFFHYYNYNRIQKTVMNFVLDIIREHTRWAEGERLWQRCLPGISAHLDVALRQNDMRLLHVSFKKTLTE
jgi:hypothetical protein